MMARKKKVKMRIGELEESKPKVDTAEQEQ